MADLLGLPSILLFAGLAGWVAMTLVAYVASRCIGEHDTRPATRRSRAEWVAAMPLAGFLLAVLAALLPAVLKAMGFIADHCLTHGLHHPHICFTHLPAFRPTLPLALLLVAGLGTGALALARWALRDFRDLRLARRIDRLATSRWAVLSADLPGVQAFLLARRGPRIVMSRSLRRVLSPAERRAVVRHEIAHARAGDPRRKRRLEFLLAFHPPVMRRRLRRLWQQAVEEHADDTVAEQGGSFELARALVKAVRHQPHGMSPASAAMAVTAADLAHRVRRLTGERTDDGGSLPLERGLLVLPVPAAAWAVANHHVLEHLFEAVLARVTGG